MDYSFDVNLEAFPLVFKQLGDHLGVQPLQDFREIFNSLLFLTRESPECSKAPKIGKLGTTHKFITNSPLGLCNSLGEQFKALIPPTHFVLLFPIPTSSDVQTDLISHVTFYPLPRPLQENPQICHWMKKKPHIFGHFYFLQEVHFNGYNAV